MITEAESNLLLTPMCSWELSQEEFSARRAVWTKILGHVQDKDLVRRVETLLPENPLSKTEASKYYGFLCWDAAFYALGLNFNKIRPDGMPEALHPAPDFDFIRGKGFEECLEYPSLMSISFSKNGGRKCIAHLAVHFGIIEGHGYVFHKNGPALPEITRYEAALLGYENWIHKNNLGYDTGLRFFKRPSPRETF
jgi:hypothetical protein